MPANYVGFRVEDQDGNRRGIEEIPYEEIRNALTEVLQEQVGLSMEDLVRETARKFGFTRLGAIIETTVRCGIERALSDDVLTRLENGNLILKT